MEIPQHSGKWKCVPTNLKIQYPSGMFKPIVSESINAFAHKHAGVLWLKIQRIVCLQTILQLLKYTEILQQNIPS